MDYKDDFLDQKWEETYWVRNTFGFMVLSIGANPITILISGHESWYILHSNNQCPSVEKSNTKQHSIKIQSPINYSSKYRCTLEYLKRDINLKYAIESPINKQGTKYKWTLTG